MPDEKNYKTAYVEMYLYPRKPDVSLLVKLIDFAAYEEMRLRVVELEAQLVGTPTKPLPPVLVSKRTFFPPLFRLLLTRIRRHFARPLSLADRDGQPLLTGDLVLLEGEGGQFRYRIARSGLTAENLDTGVAVKLPSADKIQRLGQI
jgi:hypothetical protein